MIAYCAADPVYFRLYFDLWATQMNRYYPAIRKIIAVYNPDVYIEQKCQEYGVELRPAALPKNPTRAHYYLLRWLNLPHDTEQFILETQINCLAVAKQNFEFLDVDHVRICRHKRDTLGGVSAAVFTSNAAERIVAKATELLENPYDGDHPMNSWQAHNLTWTNVLAEQQFKTVDQIIEPWCCWITAGTSQHYTAQKKLEILNHYLEKVS